VGIRGLAEEGAEGIGLALRAEEAGEAVFDPTSRYVKDRAVS